ncbi:hypothetical protein Cgig2_032830 [Carnegiea gigantea]|uniref:Uncharacterized protein n=1 Tax=Carnegiea gigantea TaxID=171969 RepID=A0A9Q1GLG1_9CARY|nr:hypothetical protein Cgig2_032830 [Carnegiea gigantea]
MVEPLDHVHRRARELRECRERSAPSVVVAMALRIAKLPSKSATVAATDSRFPLKANNYRSCGVSFPARLACRQRLFIVTAVDHKSSGGGSGDAKKAAVPNSNYVVPLDKTASCITRPLAEILRDLNKRIPDNSLKPHSRIIPWYHANRMLSFYAPGATSSSPLSHSFSSQRQA